MSFVNKLLYQLKLVTPFGVRRFLLNVKEGNVMREEDYVLKFFKEKGNTTSKTVVDVGAATGNVSLLFAKNGFKVLAVEPDDDNRKRLENNIRIYKCAVDIDTHAISNEEKLMPFYTSDVSAGIKGLNSFHSSHRAYKEVKTITFDTLCQSWNVDKVHFLKVDTEGFDLNVLEGVDFNKYPIEAIMCEYEDKKTKLLGYTFKDMIAFLQDKGYVPVMSEWYEIKEYGSGYKWRRFTMDYSDVAPNSWGNIIAVKPEDLPILKKVLKMND